MNAVISFCFFAIALLVTSSSVQGRKCKDYSTKCYFWHRMGLCEEELIKSNCPKKCGVCKPRKAGKVSSADPRFFDVIRPPVVPPCIDNHQACSVYATKDQCAMSDYVVKLCPKGCNACKSGGVIGK